MADFDFKSQIDPNAIAALAQRQAETQAQMQQKASDQKMKMIQDVANSVGSMVSSSIEASKLRQRKQLDKDLGDKLAAKYVPNVMAPQEGPGLPTMAPEGPTSADNAYQQGEAALPPVSTPDYAGRKAFSQQVQADPKPWRTLAVDMMNPLKQAETEKAQSQALRDRQLTGPVSPATQSLVAQLHAKLGTQAPDLANMTEQQANQYYDNASKMMEKTSASNPGDLTENDRKRLGKMARAVIEGRASPTALVSARGAEKEKLSQLIMEMDPGADLTLMPQRSKMRSDFTSGQSGKSLTSLNTVIGHLDTLQNKIDALDNKEITKYNNIGNWVAKNAGRPEVAGFKAAKTLVDGELGKIVQGSGVVTNEERRQFANDLNDASSPAQAKEVLSTWMDLMKSRTDALKSNWTQTMGETKSPVPFINDKSKKILIKRGYNPDTLEKMDKPVGTKKPIDLGNGFSYVVH